MGRIGIAVVLGAAVMAACDKPPANDGTSGRSATAPPPPRKIDVPGADGAMPPAPAGDTASTAGHSAKFRVRREEGAVEVVPPGEAKASAPAIAKVAFVPSDTYKVATEFPVQLSLQAPSGITLEKAELSAGGASKRQGDAEAFSEQQLVFAVKLTPAASGSYTIRGNFQFGVCEKRGTSCYPKMEPVAIEVAAK